MADITVLWNLFHQTFVDITIFNIGWIINPILTIITIYAIDRDKNTWGVLLLPVTMMYHIIGVKTSFIQLTIAVLIFGVMIFTTDITGNIISAVSNTYKSTSFGRTREGRRNFQTNLEKRTIERRIEKLSKLEPTNNLIDAIMKGKRR